MSARKSKFALIGAIVLLGMTGCGKNPHVLGQDPRIEQPSTGPSTPNVPGEVAHDPGIPQGDGNGSGPGKPGPKPGKDPQWQYEKPGASVCTAQVTSVLIQTQLIASDPTRDASLPALMFATPVAERAVLVSDFEIPVGHSDEAGAQNGEVKYTLYVKSQGGDVAHSRVLPGQPLRFIVPKDLQVDSAEIVAQTCMARGGEE